jgi:predicted restriction endonuclease
MKVEVERVMEILGIQIGQMAKTNAIKDAQIELLQQKYDKTISK